MGIGGKVIWREMRAEVAGRLAKLRQLSIDEIGALPESETKELNILGERVLLGIYRKPQGRDQTLVVTQAVHDRWFGIMSEVEAAGFLVMPGGEKVDAPEPILWDYT